MTSQSPVSKELALTCLLLHQFTLVPVTDCSHELLWQPPAGGVKAPRSLLSLFQVGASRGGGCSTGLTP